MKCCHLSCSPCPCKQHPPHSSSLLTQICRLHLAAHTPICRLHLAPHSDMLSSLSSSQAFNCLHYAAHRPQYCFHLAAIFFTQLLTDLAVCFTQLLTNLAVVLTKLLIFFLRFHPAAASSSAAHLAAARPELLPAVVVSLLAPAARLELFSSYSRGSPSGTGSWASEQEIYSQETLLLDPR